MAVRKVKLNDVWDAVRSAPNRYHNVAELERMARSRSASRRLRALLIMRRQIGRGKKRTSYFRAARRLIEDENNDCRWQALIVVGEFIEDRPAKVWELVVQYGQDENSDMRAGVACVLLEHLLEQHWSRFHTRAERLAAKSPLFADTLSICWIDRNGRTIVDIK